MDGWQDLRCPHCGKDAFARLFGLRQRAGGGVIEVPRQWECRGCQSAVNVEAMLRAADIDRKRQALAAAQAQYEAAAGSIPASTKTP